MSGSVEYAIGSKNVLKICIDGDQFQMEIRKTSSRRPRSVDNAEIGHFTLLFCRGRQRNTRIFNARAQLLFFSLKRFVNQAMRS